MVTFSESGLASGTTWSVTIGSTTFSSSSSSLGITELNGTYRYSIGSVPGYTSAPSSGSVTVAGQAPAVTVTFTTLPPGTYTVTFTAAGLPSGTSWSATLNGVTRGSTTSTVAFTETNGTYSYTVGPAAGYIATPTAGTVTVNGLDATVNLVFDAAY
jgi:hypothetical protein